MPPTTKHLSNNNPKKHEKNLKNHGKRTQKTLAVKLGFEGKEFNQQVKICLRIWPQGNDTEGFFVGRIMKQEWEIKIGDYRTSHSCFIINVIRY